MVPVVAHKLTCRAHKAFGAVGANRLWCQWVRHAVVAMASVVAINDSGAVGRGTVLALPASIAKALLFGRVASTVAGARVVHNRPFVGQTWATLDVAHRTPPALLADAPVGAAAAVLGAFAVAVWTVEAHFADAFARVHWFLQTVGARNFASQTHPVFGAADAVRWIEFAAADPFRAVCTDAVVDALWDLAAFALPTWDACADLGGKVASAVARAALAVNTWARPFIADGAKPTLAWFVALAFHVAPACRLLVGFAFIVFVAAFALLVADLVAAASGVARIAVALPAVHWALHTVGARHFATWTHPPLLAALADWEAAGCGARAAAVAVALAWAVEQLATFATPTCIAGALL